MPSHPGPSLSNFLRAIQGTGPGWTELRLLPEPRTGETYPYSKYFSDTAAAANWLHVNGAAANVGHGLYYGVAKRSRPSEKSRGAGRDEHVRSLPVVWADLDFKDYAHLQPEASAKLALFSPAPSIVVASGGGLHAYWRLRQAIPPDVGRDLMQRIATALGSDASVRNPSRVLRVPGSLRLKDPTHPICVEVRGWWPWLRYDEHVFGYLPRLPRVERPPEWHAPVGGLVSGSREQRYAQAALVKRCEQIAVTPTGQKHAALFRAACYLGSFVGAGLLDRATVGDWLFHGIERAGPLDNISGARKTIADGIDRGARELPRIPVTQGRHR